ncbi:MAG: hypothetical protein GY710_16765 [Desulfobacteraceae bacterium]|nr:hypothetical protein [Desulfobacteraceae bacterium]
MAHRNLGHSILFWKKNQRLEGLVFSSHGIWRPAQDGMIKKLNYTYHWYTQPNTELKGSSYKKQLKTMGTDQPVDSFGPRSGQVANMLLTPLDPEETNYTANVFVKQHILGNNPNGLGLLMYVQNNTTPCFTLEQLDTVLLPSIPYPINLNVHMVVCRSFYLKHVQTIQKKWHPPVNPNPNPSAIWDSMDVNDDKFF